MTVTPRPRGRACRRPPPDRAAYREVAVMRPVVRAVALLWIPWAWAGAVVGGNDPPPQRPWRALPLITDGKVDKSWAQVGWGGFVVDGDSLRTDCDERGMGL